MSTLLSKTLTSITTTLNANPQTTRVTLSALTAGILAITIPKAYRNYKIFVSYGPGGIPNNAFGWLMVSLFFNPFRREMISTDVYDRKIKAGEATSYLPDIPPREGDRPTVGPHAVPQRQISSIPGVDLTEKLMSEYTAFAARNQHLIKVAPSRLERHTDAFYLADSVSGTSLARYMNGEIAHVHGQGDFSGHATLAPADCKKVLESNWGQRHSLSGTNAVRYLSIGTLPNLPSEYVLIYAPRNEEDIKVIMEIVAASVKYMTGLTDVQ